MKADPKNETAHPLDDAARQRIAGGLTLATSLLDELSDERIEEARVQLARAADQLEAWQVARGAGRAGREAGVSSVSVLRSATGEPVSEFLLIPFGDVSLDRPAAGGDFHFSRAHAEQAMRWFESVGRKLAIDYEHQSFDRFNTRADGLRPAAGWIGGLAVRDDGLWATNVTWTERAGGLIRTGEYRYFSPVIYWADEDYVALDALGPVALTNDPAMRGVTALAARQAPPMLDGEAVCDADATCDDDLSPADAGAATEVGDASELQVLRRKLAAQEADTFVERGLRLGKIVEATSMDWRADYLRDAAAATARLARAPVILPPGRIVSRQSRLDHPIAARASNELYRAWGVDEEDLLACERAVAGGRVRGLPSATA